MVNEPPVRRWTARGERRDEEHRRGGGRRSAARGRAPVALSLAVAATLCCQKLFTNKTTTEEAVNAKIKQSEANFLPSEHFFVSIAALPPVGSSNWS